MWKYGILTLLISCATVAADLPTKHIVLRGVDKVTGRMSTMQAEVGDVVSFGDLKIVADKCLTRPPEEAPENSAYLEITEKLNDGSFKEVFNGWMFSSNPALSAMEHPVYDVWVLSCTNGVKGNLPVALPDYVSDIKEADTPEEIVVEDDNPSLGDESVEPTPAPEVVPVQ